MTVQSAIRGSLAPYQPCSVQRLLQRTASRIPDKVAVIDGQRRFTYRQLDEYSDRLAASLIGFGIAKGDRVGILAPNCAEFEIAFFGVIKSGAVATTVNSGYRKREIAHQLNDGGVETLVVHQDLLPLAQLAKDAVPILKRLIPIVETSEEPGSLWDLVERGRPKPPSVRIDPRNDLAALPYSSGTTGLSKGVMLTHFNLAANVRQLTERAGEAAVCKEEDVVLVHLPLFHIYGMNVLMNGAIALGATQVLMGRFDMELFLGLLSSHRVTMLFSVPPVGLALTQHPAVGRSDLSALRLGFFGAAPLSGELQQPVQDTLACPIVQGYSLTETSPLTNCDYVEPELARPGSVGPPAPDTEEVVVDLETGARELAPGEVGELLVRGPQVMKGYYNNPSATAETITEDGWLHTGDILRMDPDGYVWVLDRKKELIKYKGFQVPPAELEGLLLEHPAVADAAVIGKADVEAGEVPKAFVVLKAGAGASDQELMSFVGDKVATFKHIQEVEFVDFIPKNPSGKILRRLLIERERAKG